MAVCAAFTCLILLLPEQTHPRIKRMTSCGLQATVPKKSAVMGPNAMRQYPMAAKAVILSVDF